MLAVPGSQLGSRISSKSALFFWTWASSLVMVDKRWCQSFLMQACEKSGNLRCQRQTQNLNKSLLYHSQYPSFEISGIEIPNGWIVETWKQLFISLWPLPLDNGWLSLFFTLFNPYILVRPVSRIIWPGTHSASCIGNLLWLNSGWTFTQS